MAAVSCMTNWEQVITHFTPKREQFVHGHYAPHSSHSTGSSPMPVNVVFRWTARLPETNRISESEHVHDEVIECSSCKL